MIIEEEYGSYDKEVMETGVFPEEDEREIVLKRLNAVVPDMMSETLAG
jgi:hypothetical protein